MARLHLNGEIDLANGSSAKTQVWDTLKQLGSFMRTLLLFALGYGLLNYTVPLKICEDSCYSSPALQFINLTVKSVEC
jgi:hypothetical protein